MTNMQDVYETLLEAGKEALRVVLLAVIPVLITSLEKNEVDVRLLAVVGAIAFLRAIDKWLHEWGKINDDDSVAKGITRF